MIFQFSGMEVELTHVAASLRDANSEFRSNSHTWRSVDLNDNRYLVPDVEALPPREQELFLRYVYW